MDPVFAASEEAAERELRRQIDLSVSRALIDGNFAQMLLSDPTVMLHGQHCPPRQYRYLRSINANSLAEFARQARALFWVAEELPRPVRHVQLHPRALHERSTAGLAR